MSPHPTIDDELLRALLEHARAHRDPGDGAELPPPATPDEIALGESQLGFPLPPLLRRVYEIANGALGPGHGLYAVGKGDATLGSIYRQLVGNRPFPSSADEPRASGQDQPDEERPWPEGLVPICDWGSFWSCLDCRSDDGPVVTSSREPFTNTGHTLRSWLSAWIAGVNLEEEMFEPGTTRMTVNPFTRQPLEIRSKGKPRGTKWP